MFELGIFADYNLFHDQGSIRQKVHLIQTDHRERPLTLQSCVFLVVRYKVTFGWKHIS